MKILNTTTGQLIELSITDAKTGLDWTNDFMSAGNLPYNEDKEAYEMSAEDIDWWANLIGKKQANDDKISEIESSIKDDYELDEFRRNLSDCYGNDLDTDEARVELFLQDFEAE